MTHFPIHDRTSAPSEARTLLDSTEKTFGFLPNLIGIMAESPALLSAYIALTQCFERSSLDPVEQQVVLLTVSRANECDYCLAAHSTIADATDVDPAITDAIRNDTTIPNRRLEALRNFTARVVQQRGLINEDDMKALFRVGYDHQTVLDVVTGVGMKTLSNYTNHIADTPLDTLFGGRRWEKYSEAC